MVERIVLNSEDTPANAPGTNENGDVVDVDGKIITPNPMDRPDDDPSLAAASERPEWCPEKFWNAETGEVNAEALAQSYIELEKKQSKPADADADADNADADNADPDADADAADKAVEKAGLKMEDLTAEYAEKGTLTDESYAKLEKAGIPREYVDQYIAGQEALATTFYQEVYDHVGGQDHYNEMVTWAAENMTQAEIAAYDRAVTAGTAEDAMLAVSGLQSKYEAANGKDPKLLSGDSSDVHGSVFASRAQVTDAMRDPRYKTDPAYRKEVTDKLARSSIL